jgi:VanZ family protein
LIIAQQMRALVTRFIPAELYERTMFAGGLALYLAVIVLGSIPGARAEIDDFASGILLHFATYSCLTFLLATGASGSAADKALKALFIVTTMGALDELIQSFLPYRNGALADWGIDVAAAAVTASLFWAHARKAKAVRR